MRARPSLLVLVVVVLLGLVAAPALAQDGVTGQDDQDVTVTIPPAPTPGPTPTPLPSTPVVSSPPGETGGPSGSGFSSSAGGGAAAPAEAPAAAGTGEPAIGAKPGRGDRLKLDRDYVMPGEVVVATAKGLTAGEMAQMVLFSDPVLIGNQAVDADGAYRAEVVIPEDTEPGRHTLQLTGWASGKIYTAVLVVGDPAAASDESDGGGLPLWLWWIAAAVLLALLTGLGARAAWSVRRGAIATGATS